MMRDGFFDTFQDVATATAIEAISLKYINVNVMHN